MGRKLQLTATDPASGKEDGAAANIDVMFQIFLGACSNASKASSSKLPNIDQDGFSTLHDCIHLDLPVNS